MFENTTEFIKKMIQGIANRFGFTVVRKSSYFFDDLKSFFDPKEEVLVLDVGAYHGEFSLNFIEVYENAKIFAFEPAKSSYNKLTKKVTKFPNIFPENIAIGEFTCPTTLYKTKASHSSSLLRSNENYYGLQKIVGTETVECTTLKRWLDKKKIEKINFLKLDVQGLDLIILKNVEEILPKIDIIIVEMNFKEQYHGSTNFIELYQFLVENDYEIVNLFNFNKLNKRLIFCDGLFVRKDLF